MIESRRGLMLGLGAMLAAPAVVRASSLMPVRTPLLLRGDLWKCRWVALNEVQIVLVATSYGELTAVSRSVQWRQDA